MGLAIDGIDGFWAEPPQWFSFSSMLEAEACPRRWGLRRATYPGLWEGKGYPDSPNVAALAGNVVHESLEILIRALVRSGCVSTQDPEAVAVLRSLGWLQRRHPTGDRRADQAAGRTTHDATAGTSISGESSPYGARKCDARHSHSFPGQSSLQMWNRHTPEIGPTVRNRVRPCADIGPTDPIPSCLSGLPGFG